MVDALDWRVVCICRRGTYSSLHWGHLGSAANAGFHHHRRRIRHWRHGRAASQLVQSNLEEIPDKLQAQVANIINGQQKLQSEFGRGGGGVDRSNGHSTSVASL